MSLFWYKFRVTSASLATSSIACKVALFAPLILLLLESWATTLSKLRSRLLESIKLSPAARKLFPYSPECKNQEKMNIWASLGQAEANTKEGTTPVLFFKRNNTPVYAVIPAEHFFQLVNKKPVE